MNIMRRSFFSNNNNSDKNSKNYNQNNKNNNNKVENSSLKEEEDEFCDPWSIEYLYSIQKKQEENLSNNESLPKKLAHVMHKWTWQKCGSL
jgi:hypothetical protein